MNSGSVIDQDNSSIHVELHSTYVLENEFGVGGVLQYNAPIDKGDSADEGTFILVYSDKLETYFLYFSITFLVCVVVYIVLQRSYGLVSLPYRLLVKRH